eukprot:g38009.t1
MNVEVFEDTLMDTPPQRMRPLIKLPPPHPSQDPSSNMDTTHVRARLAQARQRLEEEERKFTEEERRRRREVQGKEAQVDEAFEEARKRLLEARKKLEEAEAKWDDEEASGAHRNDFGTRDSGSLISNDLHEENLNDQGHVQGSASMGIGQRRNSEMSLLEDVSQVEVEDLPSRASQSDRRGSLIDGGEPRPSHSLIDDEPVDTLQDSFRTYPPVQANGAPAPPPMLSKANIIVSNSNLRNISSKFGVFVSGMTQFSSMHDTSFRIQWKLL